MKKTTITICLLAAIILGSTLGVTTAEQHYFGVTHGEVGDALKKQRFRIPELLEDVGDALAASDHWTGTDKQAHDLIRYTIADGLYLHKPADYDVEVTLQMELAHRMYMELTGLKNPDGSRVYSDAIVELMIANFNNNYDHGSAAADEAPE